MKLCGAFFVITPEMCYELTEPMPVHFHCVFWFHVGLYLQAMNLIMSIGWSNSGLCVFFLCRIPETWQFRCCELLQFSSVQDGICALGKAHMRCTPSLRSVRSAAFETVPMLVWLTMALCLLCYEISMLKGNHYSDVNMITDLKAWVEVQHRLSLQIVDLILFEIRENYIAVKCFL